MLVGRESVDLVVVIIVVVLGLCSLFGIRGRPREGRASHHQGYMPLLPSIANLTMVVAACHYSPAHQQARRIDLVLLLG